VARLGHADLLERCTSYRAAKDDAEPFRTAKQLLYQKFKASNYGTWVMKPPEEEMFSFSPATFSPAVQKSLVRPGSTGVPTGGLLPSHAHTTADAFEDFT